MLALEKITSGEINGVIINGSQFISPFDKEKIVGGSNWVKGTLTNADGMSVLEWTEYVKASGQTAATGKNIFYYDGVSTSRTRGSRTQTSYFGVDGIQLIDTDYSSIPAATLTIEDLFKIELQSYRQQVAFPYIVQVQPIYLPLEEMVGLFNSQEL